MVLIVCGEETMGKGEMLAPFMSGLRGKFRFSGSNVNRECQRAKRVRIGLGCPSIDRTFVH